MIDKLDANSNVGHIYIGIGSNNQLNYEIVIIMINRFSNVYWIELGDSNDWVDDMTHKLIKLYV